MTARIVRSAAYVIPAVVKNAADTTAEKGVIRYAASTASRSADIPSAWLGAYVDLMSRGTYTQYGVVLKGDTAPTLVIDQAAAFGTGHAAAGMTILEDSKETIWIPTNAVTIVWISSTANAGEYFEGRLSGLKKGR